ncbi:hypothetical protein FH609_004275 [Streptomyces sp. 3MP-14]|uniref:Uncharacterized protein n=1 Tax=Streptomyces mimosae TaxID=2586635 RepID=A0A5N6A4P2_9ACTN|nr:MULTISPECIES: hypothetical protein [Streptomyces]KAB8162949.1 hypothetical protein FH607_020135 [Streptomyces mimosae]KAB8179163.1 hypothetical protein FH609_004275 [Streptomyces sp. 3MP-14]
MNPYLLLTAVAVALIAAGVGLVVLAHLPALWTTTGPVPEPTADELAAWREQLAADVASSPDLDAALRRHGLTDGPTP